MNYSNSSGKKSASSQIVLRTAALAGVDVNPPSTGYAVLTIYDSATGTSVDGDILAEVEADAGLVSCNHEFTRPVVCNKGIYAKLDQFGGSDATFIVRYYLI